jgi:hypothetical protein
MTLSSVHVPIQRCQLSQQHSRKDRARTRAPHRKPFYKRIISIFSLFALGALPGTYSLPGTNHAIVVGDSSGSPIRQHAYAETAIAQTIASQNDLYAVGTDIQGDGNLKAANHLQQIPYCFIADTDSVPYVLDTGANRVILNDAKLLKEFQPRTGSVKGIGGDPVTLGGVGSLRLPLKSDDGKVDYVNVNDAVYVPTLPYNLVPPQILINKLKKQGYKVQPC